MRLLNAFATLMIIGGITPALAECTAKSGVIDGEYWTQDGSPYCIEGDIRVLDLVIAPGVQIEFAGAYDFEIDPYATRFEAEGTANQPIIFTSQNLTHDWKGIWFHGVGPNASLSMDHCRVEYASETGVAIYNCYPTIQNCAITNNENRNGSGGGMGIVLDGPVGDLLLSKCLINNNGARDHGGGIYMLVSSGSLTLRECEINTNNANMGSDQINSHGGGIYIEDAAGDLVLEDCDISSNHAASYHYDNANSHSYGGGIYLAQGALWMRRCTVGENSTHAYATDPTYREDRNAYAYGGGIYANQGVALLSNCTISSNSVTGGADGTLYRRGAGVYTNTATVSIENCTVAYNNDAEGVFEAGGATYVLNSIVYSNTGDQLSPGVTADYSNIQGGWDGVGNIDEDPKFYSIFDLRIRCSVSPCVDAGDPDSYYNDNCQACGTERNDMGAGGGPNNCPPTECDLDIEITDIPPIVHRGQMFDYTVCVSNRCDSRLSFDEVIFAVAGQGISRELTLFSNMSVPVNSGLTYCRDLRLGVPPATPTGPYTGTVKLYLEGELLDDHSVNVTVQ